MGDVLPVGVPTVPEAHARRITAGAQVTYRRDLTRVGRGGLVNILGFVSGAVLSFAFTYALAHLLPHSAVGLYSVGWTVMNLLVMPATLGLDRGLWRFVPIVQGRGDRAGVAGVIVACLRVALPWSLLLSVLLLLLAQPLATTIFHRPALSGVLQTVGLALPFLVLSLLFGGATQGLQDQRPTVYSKKVAEPLTRLAISVGAIALGFGLAGVLAATVLAAITGALVALLFLWRAVPLNARARSPVSLRELLAFSAPQTVNALLFYVLAYSDILVLNLYTSAEEVGEYWVTTQIVLLVALALSPLVPSFGPMISGLLSQGRTAELAAMFQQVARWIVALGVPISVAQIVFARPLVDAFGYSDSAAAWVLIILAAGELWNVLTGPVAPMIVMSGRVYLALSNTCGAALMNILLCLLLVPHWGIVGAAVGTAISTVVINSVQTLEVWLCMRMQPFSWGYLKPLLAAGVAGLCGVYLQYIVSARVPHATLPLVIAELAVMGLIYALLLVALGLEEADRALVRSLLRRAGVGHQQEDAPAETEALEPVHTSTRE